MTFVLPFLLECDTRFLPWTLMSSLVLRPHTFSAFKLQLHEITYDAIYRLRFYSNSLILILPFLNSHNNEHQYKKNAPCNRSLRPTISADRENGGFTLFLVSVGLQFLSCDSSVTWHFSKHYDNYMYKYRFCLQKTVGARFLKFYFTLGKR